MKAKRYSLITGASRGLGAAFARALAARKQNLVLVARSQQQLESLACELRGHEGVFAEPIVCDLTSASAAHRLTDILKERQLKINLLVNNAGFGMRGEFHHLSIEHQLEMIRLNNQTIVELSFHLLPSLIDERGGIINVASTAGFQAIPFASVYAATKSFLTTFSLALEQELRPHGVAVVTLCPGRISAAALSGETSIGRSFPGIYKSCDAVVEAGLNALARGGGLSIPGYLNRVGVGVARLLPSRLVPKLVAKLARP
jgi:short-subunit dehydrogenase